MLSGKSREGFIAKVTLQLNLPKGVSTGQAEWVGKALWKEETAWTKPQKPQMLETLREQMSNSTRVSPSHAFHHLG